jgi:hypothetical protein
MLWLWLNLTCRPMDSQRYTTNNPSQATNNDFQDELEHVCRFVLTIMQANSLKPICDTPM